MKDTPLIIISDDESVQDEPLTKKPRRLIKNGHNVNNHQVHVVSYADNNIVRKLNKRNLKNEIATDENLEYDDDLPIRFKQLDRLFEDEANEDVQVDDEVLDESIDHLPHLDDFIDDCDYMDNFIDDSPIVDEDTEHDSESD
nr:hypothetical protein [Tanacetum cinerariifolium]